MKEEIQARIRVVATLIEEQKILRDLYVDLRDYDRKAGKEELIAHLIDEEQFLNQLLNRL